jgi:hypothetical protein
MSSRFANALKEALPLEGLVVALVGGGVWAITMAIVSQVTNFTVAAMAVFGAGVDSSRSLRSSGSR